MFRSVMAAAILVDAWLVRMVACIEKYGVEK
jgi:hypothetical protein